VDVLLAGVFFGEVSGGVICGRLFGMAIFGVVVRFLVVLIFTVGFDSLFTNYW
jgi:hypothetical protein